MESETEVKHPEIEVELTGYDGNAAMIIGRVSRALRRAGHREEAGKFVEEAMSGDYDNVLRTAMRWVTVS
jgi:hypothetical protein